MLLVHKTFPKHSAKHKTSYLGIGLQNLLASKDSQIYSQTVLNVQEQKDENIKS